MHSKRRFNHISIKSMQSMEQLNICAEVCNLGEQLLQTYKSPHELNLKRQR